MSDFTVRIRFRIPPPDRLGIDRSECSYRPDSQPEVVLNSAHSDRSIREADWLVLTSKGWGSEDKATDAVDKLMDALRIALSRFGMSADLGTRTPRSWWFRAGLKMVENMTDRTALNDEHGPMVFPTDMNPILAAIAGTANVIRTTQAQRWEKAFLFALNSQHTLTERERTAFDLYCGAFLANTSPDARFVLHFAALETLLEGLPRPDAVVQHVNRLIQLTEDANLPQEERTSLVGSLRWLRSYSIRSSGRKLVRDRLGDREYGNRPAERLFLDCYDLRNRLLHGKLPFPTRQEVSSLAAPLGMMVGHLIAEPALELNV